MDAAGDANSRMQVGLQYVLQLSEKYRVPHERAIAMYEREYAQLNRGAHIKDFLPLLAAKAIEAALRAQRQS